MIQRFSSPSTGRVLEVASLRRPEFVLRVTTYCDVIVDERLLTKKFPFVPSSSRVVCLMMLEGELCLFAKEHEVRAIPGDTLLLGIPFMHSTWWKNSTCLELEWAPAGPSAVVPPCRLERVDLKRARALSALIFDRTSDQRSTLALAFDLFRSAGAPFEQTLESLSGEPSGQDRRLALALEEPLAQQSNDATTHLGDTLGLSPRHLQRVIAEFHAHYHFNAGSWRDTRNRWRIQLAAVVLSRPGITVASVAKAVGFASSNALARAFAQAGFPPPTEIRARVSEKDPL